MSDLSKAADALGTDVQRREVDEWLDKAAANLDDGQFAKVVDLVAQLAGKPLGNRLAVAYLKTVSVKPERVGRESLQPCKCEGTWNLEDVDGRLIAVPCGTCRPEQYQRHESVAPDDPQLGKRTHLNHQARSTIHDGADRWGCDVCRQHHGVKEKIATVKSWE